jgi:hypothetical protein
MRRIRSLATDGSEAALVIKESPVACTFSSHQVVSVRNGEVTLATSNDAKMGVVQADGKLVMTGAPLMKIQGFHGHVDGTFTHNALDAVVFFPAWTALGGGGPCKFT